MKKLLLIRATLFMVASGCHSSKTTTSSNHQVEEKDSTLISSIAEINDSVTTAFYQSEKSLQEVFREMATRLQGSTGEEDTICDIPIREKQLNIGDDYIKVRGQWHFLDYEVYRAPRESTHTESRDSSFESRDASRNHVQDNLQQMFSSTNSQSTTDASEIVYKVPFNYYLYSIAAALVSFLIGLMAGRFKK